MITNVDLASLRFQVGFADWVFGLFSHTGTNFWLCYDHLRDGSLELLAYSYWIESFPYQVLAELV